MLAAGDFAPDFTLPQDGGDDITLSAIGAPVVLYFYPKDDTPGCTTEAISFTEVMPDFDRLGARVIGVSKDSVEKHEKFRKKHTLAVELVSDEAGQVCEDYGVWKEKSMYGKTFMGIERATFLIDKDRRIVKIWPKVKVAGHAAEVLEAVKAL